MVRSFAALAAFGALALIAPAASAADFDTALRLPANTQVTFSQEITDKDGVKKLNYRMDVDPSDQGYRVHLTLLKSEMPPNQNSTQRAGADLATSMFSGLTFDADRTLKPVRIVGKVDFGSALRDAMKSASAADGETISDADLDAALQLLAPMLEAMSDADTLLYQWNAIAAPQGRSLDLNKPVTVDASLRNPVGVGTMPVKRTFELTAVDRPTKRATVRMRETVDPADMSRVMSDMMKSMFGAALDQGDLNDLLRGMKLEYANECQYEMDTETGLTRKADCTSTSDITMPGAPKEHDVSRVVVQQALVRP